MEEVYKFSPTFKRGRTYSRSSTVLPKRAISPQSPFHALEGQEGPIAVLYSAPRMQCHLLVSVFPLEDGSVVQLKNSSRCVCSELGSILVHSSEH